VEDEGLQCHIHNSQLPMYISICMCVCIRIYVYVYIYIYIYISWDNTAVVEEETAMPHYQQLARCIYGRLNERDTI